MQTTPRLTVEDWLMSDPPEGVLTELVDGVLENIESPSGDRRHQRVLMRLTEQICLKGVQHWLLRCCLPIVGRRSGRVCDLGIYAHAPENSASDDLDWLDAMPIIVAEVVSEGLELRDYVDKRLDYHHARVPEYWILDHARRLFLALRWNEQGWTELHFEGKGVYTTPLLPGLELDTARLWA